MGLLLERINLENVWSFLSNWGSITTPRGVELELFHSSFIVASRSEARLFFAIAFCDSFLKDFWCLEVWFCTNLWAMGVPNSREYHYYHAPSAPFKIIVKSKYNLFGMERFVSLIYNTYEQTSFNSLTHALLTCCCVLSYETIKGYLQRFFK